MIDLQTNITGVEVGDQFYTKNADGTSSLVWECVQAPHKAKLDNAYVIRVEVQPDRHLEFRSFLPSVNLLVSRP